MDINSNRKATFYIVISLVAFIYLLKIFFLQIDKGNIQYAVSNALNKITIYPSRGIIYDRNGQLMVYNGAVYDLLVFPKEVKNIDTISFCELTGIDTSTFVKLLTTARYNASRKNKDGSRSQSAIFLSNLPVEAYTRIQENLFKYKGFYIQAKTDRLYAFKGGAHLVGYINETTEDIIAKDPYYKPGDFIGVIGIERAYEKYLRGVKGVRTVFQDRRYREQGSVEGGKFDSSAVAGPDIFSTIDLDLQKFGEELLANKVGSIVAIEPATGEILALVNNPSYDPNLLIGPLRAKNYRMLLVDPRKPLYNRAIKGLYPPGSTFKTVMALIARQEGVLEPGTLHSCHGGYRLGGHTVGCHAHFSPTNLEQSIAMSCNAYYCQVFRDIIDNKKLHKTVEDGYAALANHLKSFGLGNGTGSDLPFESKGNIPPPEYFNKHYGKNHWNSATIISLAIGQGEILLTPLQMANFCAVIANKGYFISPHTVKSIGTQKLVPNSTIKRTNCTVDTVYFESVIRGMAGVCKPGGTASACRLKDFEICGKTGTAQNPHGKDHSLFIAYAPRNNPKIAIAVIVENGGFGATYAAPIAALMIEKYLKAAGSETELPHLLKRMQETNLINPK